MDEELLEVAYYALVDSVEQMIIIRDEAYENTSLFKEGVHAYWTHGDGGESIEEGCKVIRQLATRLNKRLPKFLKDY